MQCPQISDQKKTKFCPIDEYFFNPIFEGSKVICQRGKTFFFHQKSEGIAFTFLQVIKSEYEGI